MVRGRESKHAPWYMILLPYHPLHQVALLKNEVNMILCTMGSLRKIAQLHNELVVALRDHPQAAQNFFPKIKFAIVDEAAQMAETFAPLLLSVGSWSGNQQNLEQILLVGDPKQLGPKIEGFSAVGHNMSIRRSLMERLALPGSSASAAGAGAAPPRLLETQYRMFPLLGRLVSELFYDKRYGVRVLRNVVSKMTFFACHYISYHLSSCIGEADQWGVLWRVAKMRVGHG